MKTNIVFLCLLAFSSLCKAQAREGEQYMRILRKENTKRMTTIAAKLSPDSSKEILYRIEVSELEHQSESSSGWDGWSEFFYRGDIPNAIRQLFVNFPISRIKIKGKIPDKHISFWGNRPPDWDNFATKTTAFGGSSLLDSITEPVNKLIFDVLKEKYKFSVINIVDTCEVWVAKVTNEQLLSMAITKNNKTGVGGGVFLEKNDKRYYGIDYIGLYAFWTNIEFTSKHIIYDETNDTRKFTIEPVDMDIFKDFDALNFALEPYGLHLFKEKRLEKLKLIEFHE